MKETLSLVHLAYIIPPLRCLLVSLQFVKLTHFLCTILYYWKTTTLFYKAPSSYRCLFSRFHFSVTISDINQCTATWAKGKKMAKKLEGQVLPRPSSSGVTSAQAWWSLKKQLLLQRPNMVQHCFLKGIGIQSVFILR